MVPESEHESPKSGDAAPVPTLADDPAAAEVEALPPPPPPAGVQLALGMQLIQGGSLGRLSPETQRELLRLADQMDLRGYQFAQKSLEHEAEIQQKELVDRGTGRKQVLIVVASLAGAGLASGTLVTCLLIQAGQYAMAHTVMMSGLAVVGALLGGAGLTTLLQKVIGGKS